MTDKPRFQLLNVKVLTRLQQWIVGVATLVGLFGLALCLTGRFPLGILCLGLSAVTNGLINLSATRRLSISRRQGWWLVTALFAVSGLFSLVHALAPNNTDPYVWLRFLVPATWFAGAVVAAVVARRSGRD
jgi:low temperature requirement protein LtrA